MIKVTQALTEFLHQTSIDDIPPETIKIAKEHILDCLGVTVAGSADPTGTIITRLVKEFGGVASATVICGGFKTSPLHAAFANGTMAHALDYDDDYSDFTVLHPSAIVLPAILAVGEARQASGRDLLEAYILGIEVEVAIGAICNMHDIDKGWHGTSTLGTLGAAAACSKLMNLSMEKIQTSIGIAASSSCGLRHNFGTMTKPYHAGNAAMSGLRAAILAENNFTASRDILEAHFGYFNCYAGEGKWENNTEFLERLGNPFKIFSPGIYIKQYPSCAGTHSAIDAVLYLVRKHDFAPEEIDSIQCLVHPVNTEMLPYTKSKTALEGKFSMQFCLAISLLEQEAGLEQFTDEKVLDGRTCNLMEKVEMGINPAMEGKDYLPGCIVKIRMRNGEEFKKEIVNPEGSPKKRLSQDQLLAKYNRCCKPILPQDRFDKSLYFLNNLESVKNISDLLNEMNTSLVS
jgi:2-methylcitrate dehydratase PrpD